MDLSSIDSSTSISDRRKKKIDFDQFVMPTTERSRNVDEYIREMRDNDREEIRAEKREAFLRIEQLRKKRKKIVIDDASELASYRESKYGDYLNLSMKALKDAQSAFSGEAERANLKNEDDVMTMIKQLRNENS